MKTEFQLTIWTKDANQSDNGHELSPAELEMIGGGAVMTNDD